MPDTEALAHGRVLWAWNTIRMEPAPADLMIVMGTDDLAVPEEATRIAKQMAFGTVVASGGVWHRVSWRGTPFGGTEAQVFQALMAARGCPGVLVEDAARNTGQNVTLTRALVTAPVRTVPVRTGLLVHRPAMQRRALATAERQWPEVAWRVTAPQVSYEEDLSGTDPARFLRQLAGDSYRLLIYPALGFSAPVDMPDAVRGSLTALARLGYLTRPAVVPDLQVLPGTGF